MISFADLHRRGMVEVGQRYMTRGGSVSVVVENLNVAYRLKTPAHTYVTVSGIPVSKENPGYDEISTNLFLVGLRKVPGGH